MTQVFAQHLLWPCGPYLKTAALEKAVLKHKMFSWVFACCSEANHEENPATDEWALTTVGSCAVYEYAERSIRT